MSASALYSVGLVTASESLIVLRPKDYTPVKRGILYVHGVEDASATIQGSATWQTSPQRATILYGLASAGFVVLSCDLGGNHTWGNSTVISRIGAAVTYLLGLGVSPTKVALVCTSMGTVGGFAWAGANLSSVTCMVSMLPCVDLTDIWTNNRGSFTAEINTAYGGTYSQATFGAAHNPQTIAAAGTYGSLPIQLWGGNTDNIAVPATMSAFKASVGASCVANTLIGGHAESTYGLVSLPSVISFITAAG